MVGAGSFDSSHDRGRSGSSFVLIEFMSGLMELADFLLWIGLFVGACLGSFLNVVAYRVPRELSVIRPRSSCPACKKPIPWFLNLPVLGWIILKGKANCCGCKISLRYPIVELTMGCLFAWQFHSFAVHGDLGILLSSCLFGWILVGVVVIDLETMLIPDRFSIGGACLGFLLSLYWPYLHGFDHSMGGANSLSAGVSSLTGIFIGSGLLYWIGAVAGRALGREALGEGDVKLLGCIGAFCGWKGAVFCIFGGAMLGCLLMIPALILQKLSFFSSKDKDHIGFGVEIPFGPYLALAALGYFFWLNQWVNPWFAWTEALTF
jgi:leader peptidase (prepilin peptidase)/N-methyltransferase